MPSVHSPRPPMVIPAATRGNEQHARPHGAWMGERPVSCPACPTRAHTRGGVPGCSQGTVRPPGARGRLAARQASVSIPRPSRPARTRCPPQVGTRAPLRCAMADSPRPAGGRWIDSATELGECCSDRLRGGCVDGEFVLATAEVLHEGVPGDDYLCGPVRSQSSRGSEPVLELAVIGLCCGSCTTRASLARSSTAAPHSVGCPAARPRPSRCPATSGPC